MVRQLLQTLFPAIKTLQAEVDALKADVSELRRATRDLKVEVKDLRNRLDGGAPIPPGPTPFVLPTDYEAPPVPVSASHGSFVKIRQEECIGCGTCVEISDKLFAMPGSKAQVLTQDVPEDVKQKAVDACPVTCIVWSDTP